ncbi:MAG: heavy-metal-associated domain-containing protein [Clostridiales bacterium]|nr:heavy-metal-associated domain-containing protein [Clostridiales bacterium]
MIKTTLQIDGMMCGMCEAHINDAIRRSFDVKKVTSSRAKGETVILSEDGLDESRLRDVILETGYELKGISSTPCEEKAGVRGLFRKRK